MSNNIIEVKMNRLIAIVIVSVFVLSCNKASDSPVTAAPTESPTINKESVNPLLGTWYDSSLGNGDGNKSAMYYKFNSDFTFEEKRMGTKATPMGPNGWLMYGGIYKGKYEIVDDIFTLKYQFAKSNCLKDDLKLRFRISSDKKWLEIQSIDPFYDNPSTVNPWGEHFKVEVLPDILKEAYIKYDGCAL